MCIKRLNYLSQRSSQYTNVLVLTRYFQRKIYNQQKNLIRQKQFLEHLGKDEKRSSCS